jgi:hypothetical protein
MAITTCNAHFVWWDGNSLQESHINDVINNIDQIPQGIADGFLILVLRYVNPETGQEYDNPKLGHWISGSDHYYVNLRPPVNPETVEYAHWNDPSPGNKEVTVYELKGQNLETKSLNVRINTFPNNRLFDGILVADATYNQALAIAYEF